MFLQILLITIVACGADDAIFKNSEKGYKIDETRVECRTINQSIIEVHCQRVFKRRFQKSTDVFFKLFQEADDIDLSAEYSKGSLLDNQYPALSTKFNIPLCKMMKFNLWGYSNFTTNKGNFTQCPVKPGIYYINTMGEEESKKYGHTGLPKNIPTGDYRANITIFINKMVAANLVVYVTYEEKKNK